MSGKGGKDGPPSKGKSAMKAPTSKSGLSAKEKNKKSEHETIEFESPENSDSEGFLEEKSSELLKSGGKGLAQTLKTGKKSSLGNLKTGEKTFNAGKGGKDAKTGKGKIPTGVPKVLTEVDVMLEVELPTNAEIIMDCEAANILQGIQEYLPILSRDPSLKMPVSFTKSMHHANNGDHYTNVESVREIIETLKSEGATDGEMCMISRVCPETVDEVYALVPSLKAKKQKLEGTIREALAGLAKLKKSM